MNSNETKVITGPRTRWDYVRVWVPESYVGRLPRYGATLIIPKSDLPTVTAIRAAIEAAYREGEARLTDSTGKTPLLSELFYPLHDGDAERPKDPAYRGAYFLRARSVRRPGIVDTQLGPVTDHEQIYSGVYGRASISFYAYRVSTTCGIACRLNNLQKYKDGDPLGGSSPEEDFA